MAFASLAARNFRNLADFHLEIGSTQVFLIGENGQGKTSFLECLYYLSFGSSFRGNKDSEIVQRGYTSFEIRGNIRNASIPDNPISEEIVVNYGESGKSFYLHGKPVIDRGMLIAINPSIVFCHEDYSFAAGQPELKRLFFDQTACLVSPEYLQVLREYKKILRHRNACLKANSLTLLETLDYQLVSKGLLLRAFRQNLQNAFSNAFAMRYEAIAILGKKISLEYRPSWSNQDDFDSILKHIRNKRAEEIGLGTSLSGPHRDRWLFLCEGQPYLPTASTGQIRLVSLVLRLVQVEYYKTTTTHLPVLLMDDILLELDRGKRKRFLELLPSDAQTFFTFLPGEVWEDYLRNDTLVLEMKDGKISH